MGGLWTDRQKIPDPEHPIPPDPSQPEEAYHPHPRHVPRIVTIVFSTIFIVAMLIILGVLTQVIVL